jgi:hypothetical protein
MYMLDRYSESLRRSYRDSDRVESRILAKYSKLQDSFQARLDAAVLLTIRIDTSFIIAQSRNSEPEEILDAKRDAVLLTVAMSEAAKGNWKVVRAYLQDTARSYKAASTLFDLHGKGSEDRDALSEREAILWMNISRSI